VENLYTPEFYKACLQRLTQGGIFTQWIHLYSLNGAIMSTIVHNLKSVFPHVSLVKVNKYDVLLLASQHPFDWKRIDEMDHIPEIKYALNRIMIRHPFEMLVQIFPNLDRYWTRKEDKVLHHSLFQPSLQKEAFKTFLSKNFLKLENDQQILEDLSDFREPSSLASKIDPTFVHYLKNNYQDYKKLMVEQPEWQEKCTNVNPEIFDPYSCEMASSILEYKGDL
jgi:hypothetical protein